MIASTSAFKQVEPDAAPFTATPLSRSAALMVDAYRDTIDWEDGDDEVAAESALSATKEGVFGDFLPDFSLTLCVSGDEPAAQIICTIFEGNPTIMFVYTAKQHQGKGLASRLISEVGSRLKESGFAELALYVTDGNPAQKLYEKLGFRVID